MPLIIPNQAQKHVTHNEALIRLDRIVQLAVLNAAGEPPASPGAEDLHIVGTGATGAWTGQEGKVASWNGVAWEFLVPREGWRAWVISIALRQVFTAGEWQATGLADSVDVLGINTNGADLTNRLSVKSDNVMFSHDDIFPGTGNACLKIDRADSANSAHVQFSNAWTVRAEVGLVGDDLFRIKVSPDGSMFSTAFAADSATGNIGINTEPTTDRLSVQEDKAGPTQFTVNNFSADASASVAFRLNAANGYYYNFQLYGSGTVHAYSNATLIMGTYTDAPLRLQTNTTDRLHIFGDGRESINTASPSAQHRSVLQ